MDIRAEITDSIVRLIESSQAAPGGWVRPWQRLAVQGLPANRATGKAYQGINVLALLGATLGRGYLVNEWLTYNQALSLGGHVRKGEHATRCVIFKPRTPDHSGKAGRGAGRGEAGEADSAARSGGLFAAAFALFNVAQCDGLPAHAHDAPAALARPADSHAAADALIAASGARIRHGSNAAFYARQADEIVLPSADRFGRAADYYATALHELIHWTGAPSRLGREFGKRFGDDAYAMEELVAELGAAFTCAALGVDGHALDNHAAYVASWLRLAKADSQAVFTAASAAHKAHEYLMGLMQADAGGEVAGEVVEVAEVVEELALAA